MKDKSVFIREAQISNCDRDVVQKLFYRIKPYCRHRRWDNEACVIEFDGAIAAVRLNDTDLLLRVGANDVNLCEGVQALSLAVLAELVVEMPQNVLWKAAEPPVGFG